jgi:hypothetical protein
VGIPFGTFGIPADRYADYSGAYRALPPDFLMADLVAARRAGARVFLRLAGGHKRYINSDGTFSFSKWKARVDRYRGLDISSYIADGTIAGHYILDEPHDASNWGGTYVSREMVDELAKYSKEIWPSLPTIVRGWPSYLKGYRYKYLDAAWAQFSNRFGPISTFVVDNVRDAKAAGLALVVGLNLIDGGTSAAGIPGSRKGKYAMSGAQISTWGGELLADPYVCAFISWRYIPEYLSRPEVKKAMQELSDKAKRRTKKACRP